MMLEVKYDPKWINPEYFAISNANLVELSRQKDGTFHLYFDGGTIVIRYNSSAGLVNAHIIELPKLESVPEPEPEDTETQLEFTALVDDADDDDTAAESERAA